MRLRITAGMYAAAYTWPLFLVLQFTACDRDVVPDLSPGVSAALAEFRSSVIKDLRYDITLDIPANPDQSVTGREKIRFSLADASRDVVLDFIEPASHVQGVRVNGKASAYEVNSEHIVIPGSSFVESGNTVAIDFTAGNGSLNRHEDFLYTLFVPDRARFAIPVFDQPDLKARFTLTLTVPGSWNAVANGRLVERIEDDGAAVVRFAETKPISTYLFSFVAGRFEKESAVRDGRTLTMYHRETDTAKVARNREAIFDLHATALKWLEDYTGIPYPFDKFEFVLIPSFQYGGMEHPGAILYRAAGLLLDETATQNRLLGRASVIAHETAHMWFGDLVTMKWFNDVWTKEVFANFMAAKIVNPSFPNLNHELRFMLAHHPTAYNVDRTTGANPIRQQLDNLNVAGTLYGAIIYQKAPIVMRQLENLVGPEQFRQGLREYLNRYSYANATWPALIDILDGFSDRDLTEWSSVWVEGPGRPNVTVAVVPRTAGNVDIRIEQSDPLGRNRIWPQRLEVVLAYPDSVVTSVVDLTTQTAVAAAGVDKPLFVLPNGSGLEYGGFELGKASRTYLLENLPEIGDELVRGAAWLDLWEDVLNERVAPMDLMRTGMQLLTTEKTELNLQQVLTNIRTIFWSLLTDEERDAVATELEETLRDRMHRESVPTVQSAIFAAYRTLSTTRPAVRHLQRIWAGSETIPGVKLSERDFMTLAEELAVRNVQGTVELLSQQLERIENPDRKALFAFVMPALSPDTTVRNGFFRSLSRYENRRREPWVLEGLRYLHHPLRRRESVQLIRPGLDLLEEIQRTGDIFFPKRWLDETLGGHNSRAAASVVEAFLSEHPDYPARLRGKLLQSADMLSRAARITGR